MKIQHYGLKFPFTAQKVDKNFLDLNDGALSYVESQIIHVIFTVKGSKLRDPEFGCNFLSYIFDPDDDTTWEGIKLECKNAISKYVNGCSLNTMEIGETDDDLKEKYLKINFSAVVNGESSDKTSIIKI
jgi:phage baseplate assembly protein W